MVEVEVVFPFTIKMGLREVSFTRQFMTPDGISRKVPGVWVLPLLTYFNIDDQEIFHTFSIFQIHQ